MTLAEFDLAVTLNGYINFDVNKIRIDSAVETTPNTPVADQDVDPVV